MIPGLEWLTAEAVVKGLFGLVIWFSIRTLKKIDDNQKLLFDRQTKQGEKLAELWGEHRGRISKES